MADAVKHSKVVVNLGQGNKYILIGRIIKACKKEKLAQSEVNLFLKEADEVKDINELVKLTCDWFTIA